MGLGLETGCVGRGGGFGGSGGFGGCGSELEGDVGFALRAGENPGEGDLE